MQKLKEEIDGRFRCHFETHDCWQALSAENPEGFRAVRDVLLAPGKRLRPLLFCAACQDMGCDPFSDLFPAALALELVHSFILVHDDIIDRSAERRGTLTLPATMDALFDRQPADGFCGSDFALVTGDLLYALAIESLLQTGGSGEQRTEAVRLFMRAAQDTGRGALLEMRVAQRAVGELTLKDIEMVYALKTGGYTFALPLQLAAVFCSFQGDVPDVGRAAGIAFQLQNDLQSLEQWRKTGVEPDDIRDGRRTWPLVYAGSREALREEQMITTVRQTSAEYARQAVGQLDGFPAVRSIFSKLFAG